MQGICYIVGAGDVNSLDFDKKENDIVICADGGFAHCEKFGIKCDLIIGDFDSLSFLPENENIKTYPSEKNETDLQLAIDYGISKGYANFVIFGALGGTRFEHSIGNIQLLSYICSKDARGIIVDESSILLAIKDSEICFNNNNNNNNSGYISIFSLSDVSTDVSIKGLKYEVENYEMTNSLPIGVSNEFCNKPAKISVGCGTLLIIFNGNYKDLIS